VTHFTREVRAGGPSSYPPVKLEYSIEGVLGRSLCLRFSETNTQQLRPHLVIYKRTPPKYIAIILFWYNGHQIVLESARRILLGPTSSCWRGFYRRGCRRKCKIKTNATHSYYRILDWTLLTNLWVSEQEGVRNPLSLMKVTNKMQTFVSYAASLIYHKMFGARRLLKQGAQASARKAMRSVFRACTRIETGSIRKTWFAIVLLQKKLDKICFLP